jgi:hypothetical protein
MTTYYPLMAVPRPRATIPNQIGYKITAILRDGSEVTRQVYRDHDSGLHTVVGFKDIVGWRPFEQ